MGANAFYRPSPLLNYQPTPFRDIAFAGEKLRGAQQGSLQATQGIAGTQVASLQADEAERNSILEGFEKRASDISSRASEDPFRSKSEAAQLGEELRIELTRGRASKIAANKEGFDANMKSIDALYAKNKITSEEANQSKQKALRDYTGLGEENEFGQTNLYKEFLPAYLDKSIQDQAVDVISGWKDNQSVGSLTKVPGKGYYNQYTKKYVDEAEVYQYVGQYLREQPGNKAYTSQQADFALSGQDTSKGIQLGNQMVDVDTWKSAYTDDIYNKAAQVAAAKAGFSQVSARQVKDWQMAMNAQNELDNPYIPDAHRTQGATSIDTSTSVPEKYQSMSFNEQGDINIGNYLTKPTLQFSRTGNLPKDAIDRYEKETAVWERGRVQEKEKQLNTLFKDAQKWGIPTADRTPQSIQEEIKNAYIDYSTRGTVTRIIQNPTVKKNAGNILASSLDNIDINITHEGTMNPIKNINTFEGLVMEADNKFLYASDSQKAAFKEELKTELRTNGVTGTTDKGEPYFNYKGRTYITEPIDEVKLHTTPYEKMISQMDKHEDGVYTDEASGISFKYDADIINGKFSTGVRILLPGEITPIQKSMEWLAGQTEKQLEEKNLIKTLKETSSPEYSQTSE